MKYIQLLIVFMLVGIHTMKSQFQAETFEFSTSIPSIKLEYQARETIKLKNGYSYKATEGNSFVAKINKMLVFPPANATYKTSSGAVSNNAADGGGVVGSIPGQLNVTPTGAAVYSIPIECPAGINGMQPQISLNYNSQGGNGFVGWGWEIGGLSSISRVKKNLYYDNANGGYDESENSPLVLDGQRLIKQSEFSYRTENDSYSKITRSSMQAGESAIFTIETKDGIVNTYGRDLSRWLFLSFTNEESQLVWYISRTEDKNGNYIIYNYESEEPYSQPYIKEILYGGNSKTNTTCYGKIVFEYEKKFPVNKLFKGIFSKYIIGYTSSDLGVGLVKVNVFENNNLLSAYKLAYGNNGSNLMSVSQEVGGVKLNAIQFEWEDDYTCSKNYWYNALPESRFHKQNDLKTPSGEYKTELVTADFNGDGLTDFIQREHIITKDDNSQRDIKNSYVVYLNTGNERFIIAKQGELALNSNFLVQDADSDGKIELYIPSNIRFNTDGELLYPKITINGGITTITYVTDIDGYNPGLKVDDKFFNAEPKSAFYNSIVRNFECYELESGSNEFLEMPEKDFFYKYTIENDISDDFAANCTFYVTSDLNGDGRTDILSITHNGYYRHLGLSNIRGIGFAPDALSNIIASGSYDSFDFIQYDDDNIPDLLLRKKNNAGTNIAYVFVLKDGKYIQKWHFHFLDQNAFVKIGDFNGDGYSDFLVGKQKSTTYPDYNKFNHWKIYTRRDWGYVGQEVLLPEIKGDCLTLTDVNKDGVTDILYQLEGNYPQKTYLMSSSGRVFKKTELNISFFPKQEASLDGAATNFLTDFTSANVEFVKFNKQSSINKVVRVTNSMGAKTELTYGYKDVKEAKNVNTVDTEYGTLYWGQANNGTSVVQKVTNPLSVTTYQYGNSAAHLKGKGFLGFDSFTTYNETTKTEVRSQMVLDKTFFTFLPLKTETRVAGQLVSVNSQNITLSAKVGKSYATQLNSTLVEDKLNGTTVTTSFSDYDGFGNPKTITKRLSSGDSETQSLTYGTFGSSSPNKVVSSNVTLKNGSDEWVYKTKMSYDNTGLLLAKTDNVGSDSELLTSYTYTSYGRPLSITQTAKGISKVSSFVYTASGRFVKEKTVAGDKTVYDYDESKGLLLSETDYLGHKTSYQYDGLGRLIKTSYADGRIAVNAVQWADGGATGAMYYSYSEMSGETPQWEWFDAFGRSIRTQSYGLNSDKLINIDTKYNELGQVASVTKPYFDGDSPKDQVVYTYDKYGRIQTELTPLGSTSYRYDPLTTTIVSPQGTTVKKTNAAGQLISSTVNGATVNYTYWASGKVRESKPDGGMPILTTFDSGGNRIKLEDPDAGIVENTYNGFGQVLTQKYERRQEDGSNEVVETIYAYDDKTGNLLTTTCGGVVTTNVFDGTSHFLKSVTKSDSKHIITFDRNEWGQVTKTTEKVDGKDFVFYTDYDVFGKELKRTYPTGYYTTNVYNKHGYLSSVVDKDNTLIWKASAANALGQLTQTQQGNKVTNFGYDAQDRLNAIAAAGVIDHAYFFDGAGNLNKRADNIAGFEEHFTYTTDQQLQSWTVKKGGRDWASYNMAYDKTGNVIKKSDAAMHMVYGVDGKMPHALTAAYGMDSNMDLSKQSITYTSFKKVETITQNNHSLTLSYGVDEQRRKGVFKSGEAQWTRYYLGDYEEDHVVGKIKKTHYISGGNGLAALYVMEDGKAPVLYFAYTDYQGSLMALTDVNGTPVERYAFNPWGERRNPNNWAEKDARTSLLTDRGYTMHEHLSSFGLINMNGRVYDPQLARFLSPDPQLQAPGNALNYNRYTYCMNNPMLYTDPSGEFFWVALAIGAAVGAYIGGAAAEGWEYNPGKWAWDGDTWAGIGLGAVIGGAAGVGFYYAAPALANTGFFAHFGASGTVAAYTLTGGVAGGLAGYGAGFSGGMLHSNGDWGYSHQSGIHGAKVGATVGSVIGAIAGNIAAYEPPKSPPPVEMPDKPKWDGPYYQGTEEEAKEILLSSSKMFNVETSYWSTSKGYYFAPIQGEAYGYSYDPVTMSMTDYNVNAGYKSNSIKSTFRYTYVENIGGSMYLSPNVFQRSRVYYKAHTHPRSTPPGASDLKFSYLFGIPGVVFGWNGAVYNYGGSGYWK